MTIELDRRKMLQLLGVGAGSMPLIGHAPLAFAAGDTVTIGWPTDVPSWDPNQRFSPDVQPIFKLVFDQPVNQDPKLAFVPNLATKWELAPDALSMTVDLRDDVTFQNGDKLTADDFRYTFFERIKAGHKVDTANSWRRVIDIEVPSPTRAVMKFNGPSPTAPVWLAFLGSFVVPKKYMESAGVEGFVQKPIGTGPYKLVEYQLNSRIVLERNDAYWGGKPQWQKVTLRPLTNNTARVAAILSGDVDLIEDPPTTDLAKLKSDPKITLARAVSNRVIYIHLDQHGDPPIGIPDTNGKNPLMDKRVREALSLAIDRKGIVDKIMEGVALPAGDFLPYPMGGTSKDTPIDKFDPAAAKKLLADAGYPNGFSITLGAPNGRYINDVKVAQAVAAMWSRAGIKTEVDAVAPPVFFKNRDTFKYSAYMAGWGAVTGETSNAMQSLVATADKAKGMGTTNSARYSNPVLDDKREAILREATKIVIQQDHGILPIHFEVSVWATRKGLTYVGRADQTTLAVNVKSAP